MNILQESDSDAEAKGSHAIMKTHRRAQSLLNQSLISTLFYCCMYHFDLPPNYLASPEYITTRFKVSFIMDNLCHSTGTCSGWSDSCRWLV